MSAEAVKFRIAAGWSSRLEAVTGYDLTISSFDLLSTVNSCEGISSSVHL